jgi:hypothetical protein
MDIVYASRGGRAMHKDPECRAFAQAHDLWRFDPREWVPGMPTIMLNNGHALRELTIHEALGQGKRPCAICYPTLRGVTYRGEAEDDFGHEPFEYDGVPICNRCAIRHRSYLETVGWPCATAVALGLVSREGEAA